MATESPEKQPNFNIVAGEINLDLIPPDWALTPLRDKKAYIAGWPSQPYTIDQIKREVEDGKATGIGLITGQWSNEGGLLWVDIDGSEAIPELEKLGGGSLSEIFPPTLTISSGKKHFPALGKATISGLMVTADDATGLAKKVQPIILGGSLQERI